MIILGQSRVDLFGPHAMVAFMQRLDGNGYTTPFDGENQVSDKIIGDSWQSKVETIPGKTRSRAPTCDVCGMLRLRMSHTT